MLSEICLMALLKIAAYHEPQVVHEVEYVPQVEYVTEYVDRPVYVEVDRTVECGTCGAHVLEWWYVRNDEDTAFVEVCSKCYDRICEDEFLKANELACYVCGRHMDEFYSPLLDGAIRRVCVDCIDECGID